MMERYKGREEQLMESLVKKYGETSVERRASNRRESLRIAQEVAQAEERERSEQERAAFVSRLCGMCEAEGLRFVVERT